MAVRSLSWTLGLCALLVPLHAALAPRGADGKVWIEARDGALSSRSLEGFELASLDAAGAISVRVEGCTEPAPPGAPESRASVALVGGDRLVAAVRGGEGDRLELELAGGVPLAIDVGELLALEFRRDGAAAFSAPARGDRLYWVRSAGFDTLDGTLEGFAAEGVRFDSVLGSRTFPWLEVAALFVEPLEDPRALPERAVLLDLADGGRISGGLARWDAGGLALALDAQRTLVFPSGAVREVTAGDGSVAFLSALEPALVREGWEEGGDLGLRWPWQRDRAVTGTPLSAGGRAWSRGVGVHAPSRLEYALDGSWKSLRGAVAIDDSVRLLAYKGSVEFSIYLDGASEPAWRSGRVRGGEAPVTLPALALEGKRRLALVVDMDERSFVADRADWLRMLLVR